MEKPPSNNIKKSSIEQAINLLKTNTQNIFHLESDTTTTITTTSPPPSSSTSSPPQPQPPPSSTSSSEVANTNTPIITKRNNDKGQQGGHKYSRSATTSMDNMLKKINTSFEWDSKIEGNDDVIKSSSGGSGGGGGDGWLPAKVRPRAYSESFYSPPPPLLVDATSSTTTPPFIITSPMPSPSNKKKEKRGSKLLAVPSLPSFSFLKKSSNGSSGGGEVMMVNATIDDVTNANSSNSNNNNNKDDGSNDGTLLNQSLGGKEKKARSKDRGSYSAPTSLSSCASAPALNSSNGYFDKFMMEFYPNRGVKDSAELAVVEKKSGKDYHKIFGLDSSEQIIQKFHCAHRGKLLKQGKMVITQNYVCFYSSMFMAKKIISFADITNVRKVALAFMLPTAIKITTRKKKFLFGLFLNRDAAFKTLVSQWVKCGAQISADIEQDLKEPTSEPTTPLEDQHFVRYQERPTQRVRSPPVVVGRRSRAPSSSLLSAREVFAIDPTDNSNNNALTDNDRPTTPSDKSLTRAISDTITNNKSAIPSPTSFQPAYPQAARIQKRSAHLFNEETILSINRWLAQKANEDARFRSLKGVTFGAPLESMPLTEKGDSHLSAVPVFIANVLAYLQYSGVYVKKLFSLFVDPTEVTALKASVEAGRADFFGSSTNPRLLAALLKQFLLALPVPVVSNFDIVYCSDIDEPLYRNSCLRSFVYSLSFHHRMTLNALVSFFRILIANGNVNESTAHDLASVFGPILINKPQADIMYMADSVKIVELLILEYDEIFTDKDNNAVYVMKRGFQVIKYATLDELMIKLVDPYYNDPDFVETVITTHNLYYMKTEDVANRLISMYDKKPGPQVWKLKLRLRILHLLTRLTPLLHRGDKIQLNIAAKEPPGVISWFYARHYNSNSTKEELHLLDLLVKPKLTPPVAEPTIITKKLKAKYQPLDLAPQDVAFQMALVDLKYFKAIPLEEFMAKNFTKPERSPNYQAMVQLFNRWSSWVGTEIFTCPELHARVAVVEKIISVAEFLREVHDFHGAYAITAGLNHYSITRLYNTFEKLSKRCKQTLSSLQELFSSEANHKNYREALQHASTLNRPPLVPYLGLYSKDLFVVEENLGSNIFPNTGMVNFEKMRAVFTALRAVKYFQSYSYIFPEVPALIKLILDKPLLTEDEMDAKSLEFEPRKPRPPPPPL